MFSLCVASLHGLTAPLLCHFAHSGALIDGTVFDSSYKRGSPTTFAPNQVIKGWTEAMQMMVEGDKWEMCVLAPYSLLNMVARIHETSSLQASSLALLVLIFLNKDRMILVTKSSN